MTDLVIYSAYFILLINVVLYTYSFFQTEKANVFLVLYLAFVFVMQLTLELMYHLAMKNLFAINIFFIGQMILLGLFFRSILKNKEQKNFVSWSLVSALLVLGIQLCIDVTQFLKFNLFAITITSLLIVVYALLHFYNMLTSNKEYYYLTIGVIFYLLTSTILFLVGNLTIGLSNEFKLMSWTLNAFLILVYYLFILFEWKVSFSLKREN
ncbi:hypothetical protein B0A67_04640 [Flavobacterium aquidurense]|jgi:hypothetical protein|uniref:hypothetical protein n=1 Tax=Flavobacterium aquidurense TaxID=362413 RepID=UPI000924769F|nr:hypothetical protein [Flavobacterium aquidurense]OXA73325.1 hypothetical protein B0A67_04640 [Flavobacterium aquidurense]SHH78930.1 hypothetical protein SAMN05444481_12840 [Flavobacterium frigidimaris]